MARHRKWFSLLTRWLWGGNVEAPEYGWVRWFFLRALGLLFLAAFLSLWPQMLDVAGGEGKQPVAKTISTAQAQFNAGNIGADRYRQLPTLCWFNTSDAFLRLQCAAGTALAGLLVIGIAPAPCLVLLWLIYLSLTTACGNPYSFRWEDLLLETGFLAVFLAPLQLRPSHPLNEPRPSRIALWLLRWLLFRLMIGSDILRLPADAGIPHWISTGLGFGFSYLLPLFIFLPRRPRHLAGLAFVVAQLVRLPASEHPLANAITIALCLTLLDDAAITRWLPGKLKRASALGKTPQRRWPIIAELAVTGLVICASYTQSFQLVGIYMPGPEPIVQLNGWLRPFHTFNPYRQSP
ncbi:MAG: lipase maturation factor family protein [Verrucomicrobiota bacterium]